MLIWKREEDRYRKLIPWDLETADENNGGIQLNTLTVVDPKYPIIDQLRTLRRRANLGITRTYCASLLGIGPYLDHSWMAMLGREGPSRLHCLFDEPVMKPSRTEMWANSKYGHIELAFYEPIGLCVMSVRENQQPHRASTRHYTIKVEECNFDFCSNRPVYVWEKYHPVLFDFLLNSRKEEVKLESKAVHVELMRDKLTSFPYYIFRDKTIPKCSQKKPTEPSSAYEIAKWLSRYIHCVIARKPGDANKAARRLEKGLDCPEETSTFFVPFADPTTREAALRCLNAYLCCGRDFLHNKVIQYALPDDPPEAEDKNKEYTFKNWIKKLEFHESKVHEPMAQMIGYFKDRLKFLKEDQEARSVETPDSNGTSKRRKLNNGAARKI